MNGIFVREDEPFEKAMRRFTKTCEKSGVLSELKNYRHFEKPSAEKKRKKNIAERRALREKRNEKMGYESKTRRK